MSRRRNYTPSKQCKEPTTGYSVHRTASRGGINNVPSKQFLFNYRKKVMYTITRNIKIYCDKKHNNMEWKDIAKKYFCTQTTANNAYFKVNRYFKLWKEQLNYEKI